MYYLNCHIQPRRSYKVTYGLCVRHRLCALICAHDCTRVVVRTKLWAAAVIRNGEAHTCGEAQHSRIVAILLFYLGVCVWLF